LTVPVAMLRATSYVPANAEVLGSNDNGRETLLCRTRCPAITAGTLAV